MKGLADGMAKPAGPGGSFTMGHMSCSYTGSLRFQLIFSWTASGSACPLPECTHPAALPGVGRSAPHRARCWLRSRGPAPPQRDVQVRHHAAVPGGCARAGQCMECCGACPRPHSPHTCCSPLPPLQDTMGQAVLECCRAIPDGVLLFCPSYGMIENLTKRWQVSVWTQYM